MMDEQVSVKHIEGHSRPQKEFKYLADFGHIDDCPPPPAADFLTVAYRFATEKLQDEANLLPLAKKDPRRSISKREACCSAFALSMYSTLETLRNRARYGVLNSPMFLKRLGDHYIQIELTSESGRQTAPNTSGHFDLYEYKGFDLLASVKIHKKMVI